MCLREKGLGVKERGIGSYLCEKEVKKGEREQKENGRGIKGERKRSLGLTENLLRNREGYVRRILRHTLRT